MPPAGTSPRRWCSSPRSFLAGDGAVVGAGEFVLVGRDLEPAGDHRRVLILDEHEGQGETAEVVVLDRPQAVEHALGGWRLTEVLGGAFEPLRGRPSGVVCARLA